MRARWTSSAFGVVTKFFLGLAVTLVLALLAAQASFVSPGEALRAMDSDAVRRAILLTFGCATVAAVLALCVAVPAAYALGRARSKGLVLLDALLDVPVLLSPVALGLSLLLLLRSSPGQWIQDHVVRFVFAVPGIILAQFVLALALQIRVLKSGFEDIDPVVEHVARTHGLGPWAVFWRVTLPLVRPSLIAAVVLGWCRAAGDFGATVMVAGAIPGKTETVPIAIYLSLSAVQIERAVGLSLLLTFSSIITLVLVRVTAGMGAG